MYCNYVDKVSNRMVGSVIYVIVNSILLFTDDGFRWSRAGGWQMVGMGVGGWMDGCWVG